MTESTSCDDSLDTKGADKQSPGGWFFSRKEIEENSPSRRDGIDLKKESYLRKSYCTFLQDLGMQLKVPQVTIATAVVFCHRFFIRQSHAKNDRRTIATACMFLAGKVEETPRPLKDVIIVSYTIIHKMDPAATHRIKQKEVYEQHKERIFIGERLVLATLAFDLNVLHPYKPLVDAIKIFNLAQNDLPRIAWNFLNDGLRTSIWLQFKPHIIAAGAIYLAAKFSKVKFPLDGERVWWQEFDVTSSQLEEVGNQIMELYRTRSTDINGKQSVGLSTGETSKRPTVKLLPSDRNLSAQDGETRSLDGAVTMQNNAASGVQSAVVSGNKLQGSQRSVSDDGKESRSMSSSAVAPEHNSNSSRSPCHHKTGEVAEPLDLPSKWKFEKGFSDQTKVGVETEGLDLSEQSATQCQGCLPAEMLKNANANASSMKNQNRMKNDGS